jgi:hypothetical protein
MVDEVNPIQTEINKLLYFTGQAMHYGSIPRWFLPNGTTIPQGSMRNSAASIIPVTGGGMPQYYAPNPVSPQVVQHIQYLVSQAYAIVGVSQLSARSEKPAGIDSGIAMQTYNDIESERFVLAGQSFEQMYVEAFEKTIYVAKEISAVNPEFEVMSSNPRVGLERINWSEVDLDIEKFQIQPFPTSALPQTPEGKLNRLNEWVKMGLITTEDMMEMVDFPDVQELRETRDASIIAIKELCAKIIETGEPVMPSKFDNVAYGVEYGTALFLNLRTRGAPENILIALQEFIDECLTIKQEAEAQAVPPPTEQPLPMLPPPPQV